jgi:hypothetical protein
MQDNNPDETIAKTLWSETLIDALILGLQKKVPDVKIKELIKELQDKGYQSTYSINKVTKEMDAPAAMRVKQLMGR